MKFKSTIWLLVAVLAALPLIPSVVSASSAQQGQNLLKNPGFEGGWHWQGDSYLGKVADDWVAWWVDEATGKSDDDPTFWRNQRPEYGLIGLEYYIPEQIHSGAQALQYGKRYATHTAGVYQQVGGITPGSMVQFSAWGFVFGKDPDPNRTPGFAHMKVGIDPTGGTNVFSPNVVWSAETNPVAVGSGSAWQQMVVEAVAANSVVTVFVYSSPEWPMNDALTSQWDDASLVVTGQAETTETPPPPPPTAVPGPPLPPPATATPSPDGSIIHTVQPGDTLWGIAIQYAGGETTPEQMLTQIKQLNNDPQLIYSGQKLVIALPQGGAPAVAPTPEPTAEAEQAAAAVVTEPEAPAAPQAPATSSTLCVSAYHDRNADGMRDPTTEELLANASFTLSSEQGVVGSYTSDGVSEPYCFDQLVPGTYMVQLTKPGGYNTTTPEYWAVPLPAGATANVEFGHQRDPNAPDTGLQAAAPTTEKSSSLDEMLSSAAGKANESQAKSDSKSLFARLGEIAIGVSGIFVLLLAGAVGVAFVASRRRA